jgi:type IV secretion system protein VirB9
MNRFKQLTVIALAVAGWGVVPSYALTIPHACGADTHVQCATYDANDAVQVSTVHGKTVLLQFEPGETIEDKGAGIGGEPKAWAASANRNWIFLQPDQPHADTNLMIVTNRRTYTFALTTATRAHPATWVLRFDYPDSRAQQAAQAARQAGKVATVLAGHGGAANQANAKANFAYSMRGNTELAPAALWDDGRFTYFQYPTGRDLARVFQLLPDGAEALTNFHMEGETLVVHAVAKGFVIRLGNAVLGIRNDAFAPAPYNARGTTEPGMVRVMRDKDEGDLHEQH